MLRRFIASLGESVIQFVVETGGILLFLSEAVLWLLRPPYRYSVWLEQFYFVANKSVFIISVTALFTGMVFAVQFYFGFRIVNADALVGPASALSLARELAPIFTAVVVTGRAGAAMAAELGTMRISEQIDAMEVMAVSPIQYLVSPRILAGFVAMPLLSILFLLIGNVGAYFAGVILLGIDRSIFLAHLQEFVVPMDISQGLIKAGAFGLMFSTIATYIGFFTYGGAKGVGLSTNRAVVITLVLILVSDYFLTMLIRFFFYREE